MLWPSLGDYVIGNHSYLCVVLWSHEDHPENKDKEHEQEQVPGWSIWKQGEQCPRREEDGRSHHRLKESQKGIRWEFRPSVISRVGILLSHHRKSDKEFFPGAGNQTGRDWKFLSLQRSWCCVRTSLETFLISKLSQQWLAPRTSSPKILSYWSDEGLSPMSNKE